MITSTNGTKTKSHTVGTFPKANRIIVVKSKIDTSNTQINDHSLSYLATDPSIKICYLTLCTFSFEINESRLSDTRCYLTLYTFSFEINESSLSDTRCMI
jgi:hypothetical protein